MDWFNYYGLAILVILIVPNIIFAIKHKSELFAPPDNRILDFFEQVGRYGCFVTMVFNIPHTYHNFWFNYALIAYLTVNGVLCLAYVVFWIAFRKQNNLAKALTLSILPSLIFIFDGIVLASALLLIFAVIFAPTHIYISYKSVNKEKTKEEKSQTN